MPDFSNTVVLVTGGTRGIGKACALAFAKAGAKVAICGRSAVSAQAAATELSAHGNVEGFQADIANPEDVDRLVNDVKGKLGPIEILVNNAGITKDGLLMRMKNDDWDVVMQTNLNGAFYACRAVSREMLKQRKGRIVNLSSIVGIHGQGGQANYAAAKAGLIGFTKALAQELAARNITANVVAPGYIATDMTSEFSEAVQEKLLERIPAGRVGTPEDVAEAVLFLAGPGASYITGHVLCVDGGLGM